MGTRQSKDRKRFFDVVFHLGDQLVTARLLVPTPNPALQFLPDVHHVGTTLHGFHFVEARRVGLMASVVVRIKQKMQRTALLQCRRQHLGDGVLETFMAVGRHVVDPFRPRAFKPDRNAFQVFSLSRLVSSMASR